MLFATRNGSAVLRRTLEGYRALGPGTRMWELVVVDNGSTDDTRDILAEYAGVLPIKIVREPLAGKNRALNRGIREISGSLVVLSDDDAIPDPGFIDGWAHFLEHERDRDIFGGRIDPLFDVAPPRWLQAAREKWYILFACRDVSEGPVGVGDVFGPNMAIRRRVFDQGYRFNEEIGPNALIAQYAMGSETELCERLGDAGFTAWFTRRTRVSHIVRAHQITVTFYLGRAYRHGRGTARRALAADPAQRLPASLYRRVRSACRRWLWSARSRSPRIVERYHYRWQREWRRGFEEEYLAHAAFAEMAARAQGVPQRESAASDPLPAHPSGGEPGPVRTAFNADAC